MTTNKQLRELAENATPGPWTTDCGVTVVAAGSDQLNHGYAISECHGPESMQNVDFIAAANPAAVLELLDENAALQADCQRLQADHERLQADHERLQADHERLQAECDQLRKDADRIDWLADPDNNIGNVQLPMAIVRKHLHSLRDAIDAAMEMGK